MFESRHSDHPPHPEFPRLPGQRPSASTASLAAVNSAEAQAASVQPLVAVAQDHDAVQVGRVQLLEPAHAPQVRAARGGPEDGRRDRREVERGDEGQAGPPSVCRPLMANSSSGERTMRLRA